MSEKDLAPVHTEKNTAKKLQVIISAIKKSKQGTEIEIITLDRRVKESISEE